MKLGSNPSIICLPRFLFCGIKSSEDLEFDFGKKEAIDKKPVMFHFDVGTISIIISDIVEPKCEWCGA